jgi:fumarate hydratase class I
VQLICQESAIGAQFGEYFIDDVFATSRCFLSGRIRSFLLGGQKYQRKITKDGIFVEQLEVNPARLLPETAPHLEPAAVDLNQPMADILEKTVNIH